MRFHLGAIPESPDFNPDASWQLVREPSPGAWQLMALPIGVLSAGLFAFLWFAFTPLVFARESVAFLASPAARIACIVGVIFFHEVIHIFTQPGTGRSPYSVVVFWPARLLLFAAYTGELTRRRCLIILLAPFMVISVVPLLAAAVAHQVLGWLAFVSSFNALLAGGDILSATFTLGRIPPHGIVRMQGWKTYLRRARMGVSP